MYGDGCIIQFCGVNGSFIESESKNCVSFIVSMGDIVGMKGRGVCVSFKARMGDIVRLNGDVVLGGVFDVGDSMGGPSQ